MIMKPKGPKGAVEPVKRKSQKLELFITTGVIYLRNKYSEGPTDNK
jgi:hypothetical protein